MNITEVITHRVDLSVAGDDPHASAWELALGLDVAVEKLYDEDATGWSVYRYRGTLGQLTQLLVRYNYGDEGEAAWFLENQVHPDA